MAEPSLVQPGVAETVVAEPKKRLWTKMGIFWAVLTVVVTVGLCVLAVLYQDEIAGIANIGGYSLIGVLVVAFIAGSLLSFIAIPLPYWLIVFTLPSVLKAQWGILAPVSVGLVSAVGTTLGHLPTFMIGYGGGKLSEKVTAKFNFKLYNRVIEWTKKHGGWAAFLMSAIFNPVHLPMTIAIGALRFPPPKFLLFSFLGNAVKSLFLAFAGYYGLTSLLKFIGLSTG